MPALSKSKKCVVVSQRTFLFFAVITFATITFSFTACTLTVTPSPANTPPQVTSGTSKTEILATLGQPDERETIIKQTKYIWGPPEAWWHTLEMGDEVEIWSYKYPQGALQLYFLRESETVDYQAFVDKDIVY